MILFKKIVLQKLNNIDANELLQYANQYSINLSKDQAVKITKLLKGKNIDIYNDKERAKLLKNVANITDIETAQKINQLIQQFIH